MEEQLQLSAKYQDFLIFSSEPKYDHILAEKPKRKKTKAIYFGNFMKSQYSWFL